MYFFIGNGGIFQKVTLLQVVAKTSENRNYNLNIRKNHIFGTGVVFLNNRYTHLVKSFGFTLKDPIALKCKKKEVLHGFWILKS